VSVSLAIIGCGSRGLTIYADYAYRHPELFKLVAVAEPRDDFRRKASELAQLNSDAVFSDWRQLLDGPAKAQVAIIATQDRDHVEPALKAMELGYDVLLEKPMDVAPEGCRQLVECARLHRRILIVAHVMRYTPYFQLLKRFVDSGLLGQIATLRHLEPVHFWHQAHSFVRGNWSNSQQSCPMILAKSCHDMDIIQYLLGQRCQRLSSFGHLSHFKVESQPDGASERCWDCRYADQGCAYSAKRFYLDSYREGNRGWPLDVLTLDVTLEGLEKALKEGPYGRCVYRCDNDVVDHQVVMMEFANQVTASFTMTAFTDHRWRETEIMGSQGMLVGDGQKLLFTNFAKILPEAIEAFLPGGSAGPGGRGGDWIWDTDNSLVHKGHGGGDDGLMQELHRALSDRESYLKEDGPEQSLHSHLMAFAAEQARLDGRVVTL
jgi:predicted dehydrogenase